MIRLDRDALICDLAETYHLFYQRELPARLVATLACGLGLNSRIMRRLRGEKLPLDITLTAMQIDALRLLVWLHTKDAEKGRNRPESFLEALTGEKEEKPRTAFNSPEEFMAWRASILNGGNSDGKSG